jgi:hypothetical protein
MLSSGSPTRDKLWRWLRWWRTGIVARSSSRFSPTVSLPRWLCRGSAPGNIFQGISWRLRHGMVHRRFVYGRRHNQDLITSRPFAKMLDHVSIGASIQ